LLCKLVSTLRLRLRSSALQHFSKSVEIAAAVRKK
jgi:hypothetical protein